MSHHLTDLIVADGVEDVDGRLPDVSDGAEVGGGEGSVEPAVGEERHEDHECARQRHDVPQHRPDRHDDGAHLVSVKREEEEWSLPAKEEAAHS